MSKFEPMRPEYFEYIRSRLWAESMGNPDHAWFKWARQLHHEVERLATENERLLYENRALYAEQPKMQRDAWGEGYADGRDDTLEGVPGATSNPYTEEA